MARVARAGRTGGPEHRVCKGQVRLGKHRGPCGRWRGQERDLVRGQAPSHGLQARCSGKECHAVSVRGLTARCSAGEPLLAPAVLRTRSIPGTPAPPATTPGAAGSIPLGNNACCNRSRGNLRCRQQRGSRQRSPRLQQDSCAAARGKGASGEWFWEEPRGSPARGSCSWQWGSREALAGIKCSAVSPGMDQLLLPTAPGGGRQESHGQTSDKGRE